MPTAPSRKRIAVTETLMCGLKTAVETFVPGGGLITRAGDLVERVNSRHEILTMKEVQEKHERELSQFERRMRDMVQEEMREIVTTFRSGATTGAILDQQIRNYFAINQHGYAPAMFEGLLRHSPHWEDLRRSPQNYGDVLEPGQALNPKKIPVLIEADPLRVLELMPFAFQQLLREQRGTNDGVEVTGAQDVWLLRGNNGTTSKIPASGAQTVVVSPSRTIVTSTSLAVNPRALTVNGISPAPTGGSGPRTWTDILPSGSGKRADPVGVRKEMLAILKRAREAGVLTQAFVDLDWQDGFRHDKLRKAMRLLANETGHALQYQETHPSRVDLTRWRIKPKG